MPIISDEHREDRIKLLARAAYNATKAYSYVDGEVIIPLDAFSKLCAGVLIFMESADLKAYAESEDEEVH